MTPNSNSSPTSTQQTRRLAWLVAAASFIALAAAYGSQYFGGLTPCQLCLYQRPPYWIAAPAAAAAALIPFARSRTILMVIATLALLIGAGIAGFHVGVEQHWWGGLAGCAAPTTAAEEIDEIVRMLQGRELGKCSEIPWSLFGLSMAAYNAAASTVLTIVAGIASLRFWRT